jgi:hypothetical protein
MQPSGAGVDRRQVFGTRHGKRTCGALRRPKDAVNEDEAVTPSGVHEEIFLRRSGGLNQRSECNAKSIQLLRIVLIYTGDVTPELRSAVSIGATGVPAQTNMRALKCPIDVSKHDRG